MNKNYFFIVNPVHLKKAKSLEAQIHLFFKERNDKYQIFISKNSSHLIQLTNKAVDLGVDVIIACGGDGTVNQIGQLIIEKKIKLGIIPIGSGNGISNHFNISTNYQQALKIIVRDVSKKMDIGKVDNRYFFSNIGFGMGVEFIRHYNKNKIHGLLGYIPSFLKSLFSFTPPNIEIITENQTISATPNILLIANTNQQGYGLSLTPEAKTDDGSFNLVIASKTNIFIFNYLIIMILLGFSIKRKRSVRYYDLKNFKITSKNYYINIQIDGEFYFVMKNELNIKILPKAIDVLC